LEKNRARVLVLLLVLIPVGVLGVTIASSIDLAQLIENAPKFPVPSGGMQVPFQDVIRDAAQEQHPYLARLAELPDYLLWGILYFLWGVVGGVLWYCRLVVDQHEDAATLAWSFVGIRVVMAGVAGAIVLIVLKLPATLVMKIFSVSAKDLSANPHALYSQFQVLAVGAGLFTDRFLKRLNLFM
jgi:hypothetical protein